MMREAARRGHGLLACEPQGMRWRRGEPVTATVREITLTGDAHDWFQVQAEHAALPLKDTGAIVMRKDPPFDPEYFYATHLLSQAEREGARVFNRHGRWLFMHNGQIGGYPQLRRALEADLPDDLYAARRGATDSELLFLLAMARVARGAVAADAMLEVLDDTRMLMQQLGIEPPLRFAAALADGNKLHAFRIASDDSPPTLYRRDGAHGTVIASEPLDDDEPGWAPLPAGAVVTLTA